MEDPAPPADSAGSPAPRRTPLRQTTRLTAARVAVEPVPEFAGTPRPPSSAGQVRREMLNAACLSPDDARLILAKRTGELLEAGRLARLRPMRRQTLQRLATRLGLREFDASLVIAIAQDAARAGEPLASRQVEGRLRMVGAARRTTAPWAWSLVTAAALAIVMVAALTRWIATG